MSGLPSQKLTFRSTSPLAFKAEARTGIISGYASVFSASPNANGFCVAPGAFAATLARHRAAGTEPAMLWSHDHAEPIGRWLDLREDGRGLLARGEINPNVQRGAETLELIKQGAVSGLSIGCGGETEIAYRDSRRDTFEIVAADLIEISVVSIPADPAARIVDASAIASKREFERFLAAAGFPKALAARLAAGWPSNEPAAPNPEIRAVIDRVKAATASLQKVI